MSGKRRHARGTPIRIVLDVLPAAYPADRSDIPVPPHRELSDPVSERTPAESTAR